MEQLLGAAQATELAGLEDAAPTGVTVTTLCPGPTESDFQKRAEMQDSKLVQKGGLMRIMTSEDVAKQGYTATKRGQTLVIPGLMNQLGTWLPRLLPRRLTPRVIRSFQERTGR